MARAALAALYPSAMFAATVVGRAGGELLAGRWVRAVAAAVLLLVVALPSFVVLLAADPTWAWWPALAMLSAAAAWSGWRTGSDERFAFLSVVLFPQLAAGLLVVILLVRFGIAR